MTHHTRHAQRGMTLIGTMVGLVISMLIVLTLMSAYRSVVHLTMESNADAQQSGDLAAAFLFAHLNLSDAGLKLGNPTRADDLLLCENGGLVNQTLTGCATGVSGNDPGNAIFWRWRDLVDGDLKFLCAGLLASARGQLDYLQRPEDDESEVCDRPDFPQDDWIAVRLVQPSPINEDDDYPEITFVVEDLGEDCGTTCCRPLGVAPTSVIQGRIQVTMLSRHVGSDTTLESTTCLISLLE